MSEVTEDQCAALRCIFEKGSPNGVIDFFAKISLEARRGFHRIAKETLSECTKRERELNRTLIAATRDMWEDFSKNRASIMQKRSRASLAFLITGTASEVANRKSLAAEFHNWTTTRRWDQDASFEERYSPFLRLARAIKPAGLNHYISMFVESEDAFFDWPLLFQLYCEGCISRPDSARFWIAMFDGLSGMAWIGNAPLLQIVRDKAQWVVPEIYTALLYPESENIRLEMVEPQASEWGKAHYKGLEISWKKALSGLCADCTVDRKKLTETIFSALMMHHKPTVIKWLGELFEELWSKEQWSHWAERDELGFVPLLQSGNPMTYNWLAPHLEYLWRENVITSDFLLESLTPMLQAEKKTQVKKAISLVQKVGTKVKILRPMAAVRVCDALLMDDADVQTRVAKILAKFVQKPTPEITEAIAPYADTLNAAVRADFAPWLALSDIEFAEETIHELPSEPLPFDPLQIPLIPIADVDELIAKISHFVQESHNVNELHRIINALVDLAGHVPADIEKRTAALHQSFQNGGGWSFDGYGMRIKPALQNLFSVWERLGVQCQGGSLGLLNKLTKEKSLLSSYQQMLLEYLTSRREQPLLSAPTHEGGWIAPLTLIERYTKLGTEPHPLDAQIALLRLPLPVNAEALTAARELTAEWAAPLRYTMGDDSISLGKNDPIWCAAHRARYPENDPVDLTSWNADYQVDDGAHIANYIREECPAGKRKVKTWSQKDMLLECPAEIKYQTCISDKNIPLVASALHSGMKMAKAWMQFDMLELEWQMSTWPSNRLALWSQMVAHQSTVVEESDNQFNTESSKGAAKWLCDPSHPLGEIGNTLLIQILGCGFSAGRQAAVDAMIHLLEIGRFEPKTFGLEMGTQLRLNYLKVNRVIPCLRDVGLAGASYRFAIGQSLGYAFALEGHQPPRFFSQLLELYWEHVCEFPNLRLSKASRTHFEEPKKGKVAILSKKILKLQSN